MNKLIDAGEGFLLRLLPMWDGDKIHALNIVIEDEDKGRNMDVILDYKEAVELRDYLNELLN